MCGEYQVGLLHGGGNIGCGDSNVYEDRFIRTEAHRSWIINTIATGGREVYIDNTSSKMILSRFNVALILLMLIL